MEQDKFKDKCQNKYPFCLEAKPDTMNWKAFYKYVDKLRKFLNDTKWSQEMLTIRWDAVMGRTIISDGLEKVKILYSFPEYHNLKGLWLIISKSLQAHGEPRLRLGQSEGQDQDVIDSDEHPVTNDCKEVIRWALAQDFLGAQEGYDYYGQILKFVIQHNIPDVIDIYIEIKGPFTGSGLVSAGKAGNIKLLNYFLTEHREVALTLLGEAKVAMSFITNGGNVTVLDYLKQNYNIVPSQDQIDFIGKPEAIEWSLKNNYILDYQKIVDVNAGLPGDNITMIEFCADKYGILPTIQSVIRALWNNNSKILEFAWENNIRPTPEQLLEFNPMGDKTLLTNFMHDWLINKGIDVSLFNIYTPISCQGCKDC